MKFKSRLFSKKKFIIASLIAAVAYFSLHTSPLSDQYIKNRVVKLSNNGRQCTGEQVRTSSGTDYILTASHCAPIADSKGYMTVTTEFGTTLQRRIVAEDPESDLLILEGLPNLKGLEVSSAYSLYRNQKLRAFTHGHGLDTWLAEGQMIQDSKLEVALYPTPDGDTKLKCASMPKQVVVDSIFESFCAMSIMESVTTLGIVPGSSGGPIVNEDGELVGVASAKDEYFSYIVRLHDLQKFLLNY